MIGHRHRGASCYGPDTDTYISTKFSPKTIDYALQKRCTIHHSLLYKKVQKALVQSTKRCKEFHFFRKGAATVCVPGDQMQKKTPSLIQTHAAYQFGHEILKSPKVSYFCLCEACAYKPHAWAHIKTSHAIPFKSWWKSRLCKSSRVTANLQTAEEASVREASDA